LTAERRRGQRTPACAEPRGNNKPPQFPPLCRFRRHDDCTPTRASRPSASRTTRRAGGNARSSSRGKSRRVAGRAAAARRRSNPRTPPSPGLAGFVDGSETNAARGPSSRRAMGGGTGSGRQMVSQPEVVVLPDVQVRRRFPHARAFSRETASGPDAARPGQPFRRGRPPSRPPALDASLASSPHDLSSSERRPRSPPTPPPFAVAHE
jgi:hypothetical protein